MPRRLRTNSPTMTNRSRILYAALGLANLGIYAWHVWRVWAWGLVVLRTPITDSYNVDVPLDLPITLITISTTAIVFLSAFPLVPGFHSRWRGWAWLLIMIGIGLFSLSELPHSGRLPGMAIEFWLWAFCLGIVWLTVSHPIWMKRVRDRNNHSVR